MEAALEAAWDGHPGVKLIAAGDGLEGSGLKGIQGQRGVDLTWPINGLNNEEDYREK